MALRLAALTAALLAVAAAEAKPAPKPSLLHVVGGTVFVDAKPLFRGAQPAWSPDRSLIAFARDGAVWTANWDGSGERELAKGGDPAWRRDGRLSFVRDGTIVVGGKELARGAHPSWSRDGRVAYDVDGSIVAGTRPLTAGGDPSWSPDGTAIAFVRGGELWSIGGDGSSEAQLTSGLGDVHDTAWSPDRKSILFVSGGVIHTFDVTTGTIGDLARGESPDLANLPLAHDLLPDLDQQAPANIYVTRHGRRRVLAFRSAVANVGQGPLMIDGARKRGHALMTATQVVRRSDGGRRRLSPAGWLKYDVSPTHSHWHFHPFERYELWRPHGTHAVAHDRKQGFCFGDRHPLPGARPPAFVAGDCGLYRPRLRSVFEGTSVRYVDIYPPEFHGQWIDVTGLRNGRYVLVHRANPGYALRERSYTNDAASVLILLRGGSVRVLKRCPGSARCD